MKATLFRGLVLALALPGFLQAADSQDPPPPPFVARAPSPGLWTISASSKLAKPVPGAPAKSSYEVTVALSGGRRLEVTKFSNGSRLEVFTVKGLSFTRRSGFAAGDVLVQPANNASVDFPDFSWLALENYIGTKTEGGKKFRLFAYSPAVVEPNPTGPDKISLPASPGVIPGRLSITAWINAATGLPARLESAKGMLTYQFGKFSPSDIEPSPEIRRRIEATFDGVIPP